jgi:hypothetical protein
MSNNGNERAKVLKSLSIFQKSTLAMKQTYAELVIERSRLGETLIQDRDGQPVEVPAIELLPGAQKMLEEVEAVLSGRVEAPRLIK